MGRLQLADFSTWKGAFLNNGTQTRPHCVDRSVALALTFPPKATFQLLFGKALLKNKTKL